MICYKDRTYCNIDECKKFDSCPDAANDEVKRQAARWWGSEDAPISDQPFNECEEKEL